MSRKTEKGSLVLDGHGYKASYTIYTPCDLAKGIVQIIHGYDEYMARYSELAEYLCSQGFVVCGCDMPGFGESSDETGCCGYIGRGKGVSAQVEAQTALYGVLRGKYRYLPYMIYSMGTGTIVAKEIVYEYPDLADGVVFCGVILPFDGVGAITSKLISLLRGKKYRSRSLHNRCFNNETERFEGEKHPFSYVSSIAEEREEFKNDALTVRTLTASSIKQFINAETGFLNKGWFEGYPTNVYTLIMSGKEDPVGGYGKAAVELYERLADGWVSEAECVLYENSRHHLLHDADKEQVYQKLLEFFEKVVDGVNAARTTDRAVLA